MGNSCCSNDSRKGNEEIKKQEIEQYIIDQMEESNRSEKKRQIRFSNQRGGFAQSSLESSQYTLNELLNKDKKKIMSPQTMTSSSQSSQSQPAAQKPKPRPNEKLIRLQLLREKQQVFLDRKVADDNFESNAFSRQKQFAIIKTIKTLSQGLECDYQLKNIQRYDYAEVRKFLTVSNWNYQIAARKINLDIQWRAKYLPVKSLQVANFLKTQQIFFQGCDRDLCPCIYIKPNFQQSKQRKLLNQLTSSSQFQREYTLFFTFIIENVLPKLVADDRMNSKLSVLIDLEKEDFRIDIIEAIEELIQYHFPNRLNKIFVININIKTISLQVQARFQQQFYKNNVLLFDENYQVNLIKFFDPQELYKEYGGQVVVKANYEKIQEFQNVEEFMINEFRKIYPAHSMGLQQL